MSGLVSSVRILIIRKFEKELLIMIYLFFQVHIFPKTKSLIFIIEVSMENFTLVGQTSFEKSSSLILV